MDSMQFTIYGFDAKIKFIQYLRAIAPLVGVEKPGLKAAKEIADKVEAGNPLTIVVGLGKHKPDLCLVLKNYAKAIGAKTENPQVREMDFHVEVANSLEEEPAFYPWYDEPDQPWNDDFSIYPEDAWHDDPDRGPRLTPPGESFLHG